MDGTTRRSALVSIVRIGLIAGTLDISDNLIFNHFRGITPKMVFQYIASGLIGIDKALALGGASVTLGVVLHYFITTAWTATFYFASGRLSLLQRRPIISGLVYGGIVYVFMNFAVLPLSRVPHVHSTITLANRLNGVLAVVLCIGLTISLLARRGQAQ